MAFSIVDSKAFGRLVANTQTLDLLVPRLRLGTYPGDSGSSSLSARVSGEHSQPEYGNEGG